MFRINRLYSNTIINKNIYKKNYSCEHNHTIEFKQHVVREDRRNVIKPINRVNSLNITHMKEQEKTLIHNSKKIKNNNIVCINIDHPEDWCTCNGKYEYDCECAIMGYVLLGGYLCIIFTYIMCD